MRDRQSLTHSEQKIRGIILMQCVKSRDVQYAQCSKVCMHIYMRQTQQTFMRLCMNNHPCLRAVRQKSNCLPYNTQNVDWFLHSKCIKRSVWFVRTYNACKSSLKTFAREGVYERHQKKSGFQLMVPYVRIGLNESQDRNCSSKQIQLPKAMFREGNERVVCSRL